MAEERLQLKKQRSSPLEELYNVYRAGGNYAGRMRLNHGWFYVDYGPDRFELFDCEVRGADGGCFDNDRQRTHYLNLGCQKILEAIEADEGKGEETPAFDLSYDDEDG